MDSGGAVFTARGSEMYKHLLLPTDGSVLSESAIRNGIELAKVFNARVTGIYVIVPPMIPEMEDFAPVDVRPQTNLEELKKQEAEKCFAVIGNHARQAGVQCECMTVTSQAPFDAIVNTATDRGCDLIVMASHGRKGPTGEPLGSETQKVLTHCKIPVLVYR